MFLSASFVAALLGLCDRAGEEITCRCLGTLSTCCATLREGAAVPVAPITSPEEAWAPSGDGARRGTGDIGTGVLIARSRLPLWAPPLLLPFLLLLFFLFPNGDFGRMLLRFESTRLLAAGAFFSALSSFLLGDDGAASTTLSTGLLALG